MENDIHWLSGAVTTTQIPARPCKDGIGLTIVIMRRYALEFPDTPAFSAHPVIEDSSLLYIDPYQCERDNDRHSEQEIQEIEMHHAILLYCEIENSPRLELSKDSGLYIGVGGVCRR